MAFTEKYVTVSGGGLHDGSSEANAWTWDEAVANCVAGDRINVKAGSYTTSGTSTTTGGAQGNAMAWRGYTSTIGDLDGKKLSGLVGGTDIPTVSCSTNDSFLKGTFYLVSHIEFTSSANYMNPAFNIGGESVISHCRFLGNGSLGCTILKSVDCAMHDCHLTVQRGNFPCCSIGRGAVDNCVFVGETGGSNTSNGLGMKTGSCTNSLFIGFTGYALAFSYAEVMNVSNCTFVDNEKCIVLSTTHGGPRLIVNNYFADSTYALDNTWTYQNRNSGSGDYDTWVVTNNVFKNVTNQVLNLGTQLLTESLTDSTDQFVDSAANDYTLKSSSVGYAKSSPATVDTFAIPHARDIGAIQHADPSSSGGGGPIFHPLAQ